MINIARRTTIPANPSSTTADVVVCTTSGKHLLDKLPLDSRYFTHHATAANPRLLGFECHAVLRDRLAAGYDYYCYLEDDLILRDPLFFTKLRWFTNQFGEDLLLMPNRFEVGRNQRVHKAFVDGPLRPGATSAFQDVTELHELTGEVLGSRVVFQRSTNPHSGSFFLNAPQMATWAAKPHFLDRDTNFIGPLESAATLGVMRTFRVYKPVAENASFLELEHSGTGFLSKIRPAPQSPTSVPAPAPAVIRSRTDPMHVLFVHQNFPAQFGHIAARLAEMPGYRCTFVSRKPPATEPFERIQYRLRGGATKHNHACTRSFENAVHHALAVYAALRDRPDIRPDLVVGHSGFGSTLYLRELYPNTPIINYFEYFYHTRGGDIDFRPEFPVNTLGRLRARTRNAMILLDLEACAAGYSPTHWQQSRLPAAFRSKVSVIHDGIDMNLWKPDLRGLTPPGSPGPRQVGEWTIPVGTRLVTYVSRGFESMRGFDIFMKVAKRLCDQRSDVVFAVVGEDRVCYGGDSRFTKGKSFKEWVLSQDNYDLSRIRFLGRIPPRELAKLLGMSDLHLYLTTPFVLSWSLLNAMACGAPVLASDTSPVLEVIRDGETGLLAKFHDIDSWCEKANAVLDDPPAYRAIGNAGRELVRERYSTDVCFPQLLKLFTSVVERRSRPARKPPANPSNRALALSGVEVG